MTSTVPFRALLMALSCAPILSARPLPAQAEGLRAGATDRLALDLPADAIVTAIGIAGSGFPELFGRQLAPASCRWCDGSTAAPSVNSVDRYFHDALTGGALSRSAAGTLSTVVAFGLAPAVALGGALVATGPHATEGAGLRAAAIVLESTAIAGAIAQSLKLLTARARPFVRYGHGGAPGGGYDASDFDARLSFPSGHTTVAAALGASVAMTATLEESAAAPWLWAAAGVLTASTAGLRIAAEKHYFTDVLAAAAIGGGCGVALPLLHRRGGLLGGGGGSAGVLAPASGGLGMIIGGAF